MSLPRAEVRDRYPTLNALAAPVPPPPREIVGRDKEQQQVLAALMRPEISNVLLTAEPGSGKTAVVQAVARRDTQRLYLEVDPARMIARAGSAQIMASQLKEMFDEAEAYVKAEGRELVLFIDEFHQIVQLSDAAVEVIKPVLAASGVRGIRVIAATTYDEFHQHVSKNLALVERLQRINLAQPDQETTVSILAGMAGRYGVTEQFYDDHLFRLIYEYTDRYIPASSQPRKSILVLDSMVGWHRLTGRPMDKQLLADVLSESAGVNVTFTVDATRIKQTLDRRVFSQDYATAVVARRLQLCVADLHDKQRPVMSLILSGSSGVGKTELSKQLARLLFGDDQRHLVRMDMTEFSSGDSLESFRVELTRAAWNRPHAVLLLDEIEKAHATVTRVLLQVLDDGRLSDEHHREVSFLNTYILMTTNAGSEVYRTIARYEQDDTGSGRKLLDYQKLIRRSLTNTTGDNRFPPELLGRVDAIVPFQPLSRETQRAIVRGKLRDLRDEVLAKHGVRLQISPDVSLYLVEECGDTESDAGGARAAVATLADEVTTAVAQFVNTYPHERVARVLVTGQMASQDKSLLKGDAHVEVRAAR